MTLRRSSRRRNPPDQKPSNPVQDVPAPAGNGTKRKLPAALESTKDAGIPKRAKKPPTVSTTGGSDVQNGDMLSSLSPEIFTMIADNITHQSNISALMRTCKRLYALMAPRLYNRIAVAAMFHAHIAKLIRTLEPHLTIKQKKQLKKEGKYKGQQEKYPTGLDENRVPTCAGYVRQLILGHSNPGKRHKYIVERYCEEILKNMENLEIVETSVVTKSICEGIASLAGLKALNIQIYYVKPSDVAPLMRLKNLKHLRLHFGYEINATGQCLMRNSMSTIQSLHLFTNSLACHCFQDWEKILQSSGRHTASTVDKGPDFPALRTLHIEGMHIDEEFIKGFRRAIEFSRLRKLTFAYLRDSQTLLWPFLTDLITSYKRSNAPLDLRTLSIDMHDSEYEYTPVEQKAQSAARCSFIASFDTLTTLKLHGYGQYKSNAGLRNPGLSDTLLQAILKHQNLRVLRMSYRGIISGLEIPYLGAKAVGDIIDGLPRLVEFQFAPDEPRMDEISQALCRGEALESVTCFPHQSWNAYPRPDPLGINILLSILSTFMSNAKIDADGGQFVWEDHYKLGRVDLIHTRWDIASKFGKAKKGHSKPERFQLDVGGDKREVYYQLVPQTVHIHVGYDPSFEWTRNVEWELE